MLQKYNLENLPWQIQRFLLEFQNVATTPISYYLFLKYAMKVQKMRHIDLIYFLNKKTWIRSKLTVNCDFIKRS